MSWVKGVQKRGIAIVDVWFKRFRRFVQLGPACLPCEPGVRPTRKNIHWLVR